MLRVRMGVRAREGRVSVHARSGQKYVFVFQTMPGSAHVSCSWPVVMAMALPEPASQTNVARAAEGLDTHVLPALQAPS